MKPKVILTIAGSDSSGGAGIQADLAVMASYRMYGESVVTAVTAQNTLGVQYVYPLSAECIGAQLDSVFSDIVPDAVKIGMIPSEEAVIIIADKLKKYGCGEIINNSHHIHIPVVVDPVLISTSGKRLMQESAEKALVEKLFPIATVITPNIPEDTMMNRNSKCYPAQCAVLIKGGHGNPDSCAHIQNSDKQCVDVLYLAEDKNSNRAVKKFFAKRISNTSTHGTGCTLSTAIACELAKRNNDTVNSVGRAKRYCTKCIAAGLKLGKGRGPLWHFA